MATYDAYGDWTSTSSTPMVVPGYTTTTTRLTTTNTVPWSFPPITATPVCADGHETGDEIEFAGGDVFAYCNDCGERVKVTRIPFDSVSQYVAELLKRFIDGDIDGESLADLVVLRQTLREEQERILLAMEQLELAEMLALKSDE